MVVSTFTAGSAIGFVGRAGIAVRQSPRLKSKIFNTALYTREAFSVAAENTKTPLDAKANTHKDNNEIPLRAKEVLPGNRKDFSFVQKSAGLRPRPEDAG